MHAANQVLDVTWTDSGLSSLAAPPSEPPPPPPPDDDDDSDSCDLQSLPKERQHEDEVGIGCTQTHNIFIFLECVYSYIILSTRKHTTFIFLMCVLCFISYTQTQHHFYHPICAIFLLAICNTQHFYPSLHVYFV